MRKAFVRIKRECFGSREGENNLASILIIEDESVLARNISDSLRLAGYETEVVATGEEGLSLIERTSPDLVLLDFRLPGIDGLEVLSRMRAVDASAAAIMITAHGNIETAVEAMKRGASDFLTKPLDLEQLQLVVERTLAFRSTSANLNYFRQRERADAACDRIIGECESMRSLKALVHRITSTPVLASDLPPSVLVLGETGTGKDLVARAIHYSGPRKDAQFVHVNCTAIPEHLVESELFGHVKGAFTDARSNKMGLFELANNGTVFLDEIGHMPLTLQVKLLAILEQRKVRPVGSTRDRVVNVHVITATNRDLLGAIKSGEFREDLYHRVRVLTIEMPPLRKRGDDIVLLADHFLHMFAGRFGVDVQGFTKNAIDRIMAYDWPGNVRELMHAIESAVLIADTAEIRAEHLNIHPVNPTGKMEIESVSTGRTFSVDFRDGGAKLDDIEFEIIQAALRHANHNLSRASRILGISRDAVRYRLEKHRERQKQFN